MVMVGADRGSYATNCFIDSKICSLMGCHMNTKISRAQKQAIVRNVQAFFADERGEQIGDLGAEQFVDFMLNELKPYIYNEAIVDARKIVQEKWSQLEDELYEIEKPVS